MNCKRANQEIALSVGRDLDPISEQELRRHLAECPDCHDQWDRLRASTELLNHAAVEETVDSEPPRLWSSISQELPYRIERRTTIRYSWTLSNTVVPLVAVASLMFAVFSIQQSLKDAARSNATAELQQNSPLLGGDPLIQPAFTSTTQGQLFLEPAAAPIPWDAEHPIETYRIHKMLEEAELKRNAQGRIDGGLQTR